MRSVNALGLRAERSGRVVDVQGATQALEEQHAAIPAPSRPWLGRTSAHRCVHVRAFEVARGDGADDAGSAALDHVEREIVRTRPFERADDVA